MYDLLPVLLCPSGNYFFTSRQFSLRGDSIEFVWSIDYNKTRCWVGGLCLSTPAEMCEMQQKPQTIFVYSR